MAVPKQVNILGQIFRVKIVPNLKDTDGIELSGLMEGEQKTIKLSSSLNESSIEYVLLHEVVHAVFYVSGASNLLDDKVEESLTVALEHGLGCLYKLRETK